LFFAATRRAGHSAALSASATEFALALTLAGFVGALAQAYRRAHPCWLAFLMAASLLLMRRGIRLAEKERTSLREDLRNILAMLRGHSCDP
jgi:hypothetical protein